MSQLPTSQNYSELYGFDADWRQDQLALLGLTPDDDERAALLHSMVLNDSVSALIIDAFYDKLLNYEQSRRLLTSFDLDRLRQAQVHYLDSFGVDYRSADYFEQRLRVGVAHARVGVPLSLYLSAYSILQQLILDKLGKAPLKPEEGRGLAGFVLKITALDIALATEVYHRAEVRQLEDSVQRMRGEREVLRLAMRTDELTGLLNRSTVLTQLERIMSTARKTGQPLCVAMADLDYFKQINDEHGHLMGDQVLRGVAARVKSAVRDFDFAGRYGGEEFLLIFENTSLHTARQAAERVRQRVADGPIHLHDTAVNITVSQGLAEARADDTAETLIDRADQALYQAKQSGRNCVALG